MSLPDKPPAHPGPGDGSDFEDLLNLADDSVRRGRAGALREVLAEARRLGNRPDWALPLLERAVEAGQAACVSALLEAGVPADLVDDQGATPLIRAARAGHGAVVRLLLDAGADPDFLLETAEPSTPEWERGRSALFHAMEGGHREAVRLLQKVTDPRVRRLARRALEAHRQDEEGDEPGGQTRADMALITAIFTGQPGGIGPALAAGARIDGRIWQETTLLWAAAFHGNRSLAGLLLGHGADPNAPGNARGETPLIIAVRLGHEDLIRDLVAAGADPARADAGGLTAWDYGARPLCREGGEALRRIWGEGPGSRPPAHRG